MRLVDPKDLQVCVSTLLSKALTAGTWAVRRVIGLRHRGVLKDLIFTPLDLTLFFLLILTLRFFSSSPSIPEYSRVVLSMEFFLRFFSFFHTLGNSIHPMKAFVARG